jgi:tetraacyldisaccharide 4'-kinase
VLRSAAATGAIVAGHRFFPDHHRFTDADRAEVQRAAGDARLVTTEKDAQRLPPGFAVPLVMDVALEADGEAKLLAALRLA